MAHSPAMRWEALFADLDAQFESESRLELESEVADRTRRELARLRVVDRARMAIGCDLTAGLGAAGTVTGSLLRVGPDWLLLSTAGSREALVAAAAIYWMTGLPPYALEPDHVSAVESRYGFGYLLRALARDRSTVMVVLRDGASLAGTIDRVGADFLDLAEHPLGESRRWHGVTGGRTVMTDAVALIRRG